MTACQAPARSSSLRYHALNQTSRAVDNWETVVSRFPGSDVARKSTARLRYLAITLDRCRNLPA